MPNRKNGQETSEKSPRRGWKRILAAPGSFDAATKLLQLGKLLQQHVYDDQSTAAAASNSRDPSKHNNMMTKMPAT